MDAPGTDADTTPVCAGRDKELLRRRCGISPKAIGLPQSAVPVLHPGKRVGLTLGIENDQGHGHLIQVQLVDEAIARLACEVPQQRLASLHAPVT